jgi:Sulfotransferase family
MTLPNFLIIGSAKSGTTALFEYLEQHPEVFLSNPKEPHFLALEGSPLDFRGPGDKETINRLAINDLSRYEKLFAHTGNAKAIGEASVSTMYYAESIERIAKYMPHAKILCMLRQPADRAYSAYSFMRMRMLEPCADFSESLADETRRIEANWHHIWHYKQMGFYYQQLKPYFDKFGKDRIKIYLFEEFRKSPSAILRDCFNFLGIDANFVPTEKPTPHISGMPRSKAIQLIYSRARLLRTILRAAVPKKMKRRLQKGFAKMNLERIPIPLTSRTMLTDIYRDDILRLQELIGQDLSGWLSNREIESPTDVQLAL